MVEKGWKCYHVFDYKGLRHLPPTPGRLAAAGLKHHGSEDRARGRQATVPNVAVWTA